jgi:hypothetical protein
MMRVFLISLGVALLTLVPYVISQKIASPNGIFSGFLLNPIDGFSYLAKMREGAEGAWMFHLPYAVEPGEGAFIFVYYIFLGRLVRITGLHPLTVYHGARVLGVLAMNISGYLLLRKMIEDRTTRWVAFSLFLVGSGFGWLGILFNRLPSDLWIPESIPFLSGYTNPHFPLATALILLTLRLIFTENMSRVRRVLAAGLCSTVLALIQPFGVIILGMIILGWVLVESWVKYKESGDFRSISIKSPGWIVGIGIVLGGLPWLIYDYVLTLQHPVLKQWNAQNLTPSPPVGDYLFGFGGVLILAIASLTRRETFTSPRRRLLVVWFILQALALYAPFGLQRRLSLSLYFPLAILSVMLLRERVKPRHTNIAFLGLIILSLPSNLIVIGSGIAGVASRDHAVVLSQGEFAAYEWLSINSEPRDLVLAGYESGNRIPAYGDVRVLYGHPFETPNADAQKELILSLYADHRAYDDLVPELQKLNIRYVLYGPREQDLAEAGWLSGQTPVSQFVDYQIYEIERR